jgi:hypothetical protein
MSTPNPPDSTPPPPVPPVQQAFEHVMAKARWGVIGALIGGVMLSGLNHLSRNGRDPIYIACLGATVGAFAGAALAGRGLGPIGYAMIACLVLSSVFCCGSVSHQEGALLLVACCVAIGFLIGAAIELSPHFGHGDNIGSRGAPPPGSPDGQPDGSPTDSQG